MKKLILIIFILTLFFTENIFAHETLFVETDFQKLIGKIDLRDNLYNASLMRKQYYLHSMWKGKTPEIKREQRFGSELLDRIKKYPNLGIPIYTVTEPYFRGLSFIKDEILICRFFRDDGDVLEINGKINGEILKKLDLKDFKEKSHSLYYFRENEKGVLKKKGESIVIPEVYELEKKNIKIIFVKDSVKNPVYDRNRIYVYIRDITEKNFHENMIGLHEILKKNNIDLKFEKYVYPEIFIDEISYPKRYLDEVYSENRTVTGGMYLTHFVYLGKIGFGGNNYEKSTLVRRIIEQDYLSSFRERLYSFSGKGSSPWHTEMGNCDKVFLSYGSGLHSFDNYAFMFLFSPELLYLDRVEILDSMDVTLKLKKEKRDLLSKNWCSTTYFPDTKEEFAEIRKSMDDFYNENRIGSLSGRKKIFNRFNKYFSSGRVLFEKNLNNEYCNTFEETYNEIRIPDNLFISRYCECVILPFQEYDFFVNYFKSRKMDVIGGLPVEHFFIPAIRMNIFSENGENTNYNYQMTYLEYLLREGRRSEYLALLDARKNKDYNTVKRILEKINVSGEIMKILDSDELKKSRNLRKRLRETRKPEKRKKLLDEYLWWLKPGEEKLEQSEKIGVMTEEFLNEKLKKIKEIIKETLNKDINIEKIVLADVLKNINYLRRINGELHINKNFISWIRYKMGLSGVEQILVHESLSGNNKNVFRETELIMKKLGLKADFVKLAEALGLSTYKIDLIRKELKD